MCLQLRHSKLNNLIRHYCHCYYYAMYCISCLLSMSTTKLVHYYLSITLIHQVETEIEENKTSKTLDRCVSSFTTQGIPSHLNQSLSEVPFLGRPRIKTYRLSWAMLVAYVLRVAVRYTRLGRTAPRKVSIKTTISPQQRTEPVSPA